MATHELYFAVLMQDMGGVCSYAYPCEDVDDAFIAFSAREAALQQHIDALKRELAQVIADWKELR